MGTKPQIGKKVMQSASKNLVPVTLELGGKCPTIIAEDNLNTKTVNNIISTKLVKSGQMCIAPDYVFVAKNQLQEFITLAQKSMQKMYPSFDQNNDYTSIINQRHYERLMGYINDAK